MTVQTTLLVAVIGFGSGLAALAVARFLRRERTRREQPPASPGALALAAQPARRRPAAGSAALMLAPVAAVLLGTGALFGFTLAMPPPPAARLPPPVHGVVGDPMTVGGVRLTVLAVEQGAPPPGLGAAGDGLVTVRLEYRRTGPGATVVSPYDWVLSDAAGAAYGAVQEGVPGALGEGVLAPNASARGTLAFVVPRGVRSLVLHFDAELGDESADVPLS